MTYLRCQAKKWFAVNCNHFVFNKEEIIMNKFLKMTYSALIGLGLVSLPALAQAGDFTVKVEPGVAVPLTHPQSDRFHVGGAFAVKGMIGLTPYIDVGPSVSFVALPSAIPGIKTGTLWGVGAGGRIKRPHDESNEGSGFSAVSPWVDADLQYVRTDGLNRFGWTLGAGAAVPTSDARTLWIGPFIRYQGVVQGEKVGYNTNDARIFIAGLSFEFGGDQRKPVVAPPVKEVPVPCPEIPVEPTPVPVPVIPTPVPETKWELKQKIQFKWDSAVIEKEAQGPLNEVVTKLMEKKSVTITIEGHASSEGQVAHNQKLSESRAKAVRDYLVAHGIPAERLTVKGYGSSVPVADNSTEAGRVLNRRVEFVVIFTVEEGK